MNRARERERKGTKDETCRNESFGIELSSFEIELRFEHELSPDPRSGKEHPCVRCGGGSVGGGGRVGDGCDLDGRAVEGCEEVGVGGAHPCDWWRERVESACGVENGGEGNGDRLRGGNGGKRERGTTRRWREPIEEMKPLEGLYLQITAALLHPNPVTTVYSPPPPAASRSVALN